MKRLLALAALLLPIYLFAQGFGSFSHDQPFLAASATSGGSEPGTNILFQYTNMYRWWVASDIPYQGAVTSQWLDRIVSSPMAQGNPVFRPTNTSGGVDFQSGTYFTNPVIAVGGAASRPMFLFIVTMNTNASWLWGGAPGPGTGFFLNPGASGGTMLYLDGAAGTKSAALGFPTNVTTDFLMFEQDFYTNGVMNKTNLANNLGGGAPLDTFGWGPINTGYPMRGLIREIIVWTNTALARPISSTVLSNLHFYATNRYPGTINP